MRFPIFVGAWESLFALGGSYVAKLLSFRIEALYEGLDYPGVPTPTKSPTDKAAERLASI